MAIAFYFRCGICVSVLFYFVVFAKDNAGETCTLSTGAKGVCKYLVDCFPAIIAVSKGQFPSDVCESEGSQNIVCCEDTSPVTVRTLKRDVKQEIPSPKGVTDVTTSKRKPGEVSKQKCKEYAKYAFDMSGVPILTLIPGISNTLECAYEELRPILQATFAARQELPHMALIGYKTGDDVTWACGGSLISENFVLTAGHCLRNREFGPAALVRVGLTNLSDHTHTQERKVSEIIDYPDYVNTTYHDIGLLKLSRNVKLDTFSRPACLQTGRNIPYAQAIASGWGRTAFSGEGSKDLLKVLLEFFDAGRCNNTYKRDIITPGSTLKDGIIDDWMVCAGSSSALGDTCQSDSGGPLQMYHRQSDEIKCMYDIVGVNSFGKSCGLAKNAPGVHQCRLI